MKIVKIIFAILVGYLFGLVPGTSAAPLQVFVSIPPQKWLADQVGGHLVTTDVLVDSGQEPHSFEPTPKQIAALFCSQLYFTVDMEFARQISRRIRQASTKVHIVDVTKAVPKISINGHEHEGRGGNSAEEQRHNGLDPHVWLAPANLKIMAGAMASAMAAADPKNKVLYERNLQAVTVTLDHLHRDIQQALAPYKGSTFLVFHPAFAYFAQAYGLHQEAVEVEGKSPSPRQLYSLLGKAKKDKVKVVFVQPQFDRKSAQAIASGIGGEVVALNPLAEDVIGNLKIMAEKIQAALRDEN